MDKKKSHNGEEHGYYPCWTPALRISTKKNLLLHSEIHPSHPTHFASLHHISGLREALPEESVQPWLLVTQPGAICIVHGRASMHNKIYTYTLYYSTVNASSAWDTAQGDMGSGFQT